VRRALTFRTVVRLLPFAFCLLPLFGAFATALAQAPEWQWRRPPGVAVPPVPDNNPMSTAKVDLGRYLFYDTRLSGNGTQSCASCHQQARAFTDGLAQSVGSTGQKHPRGSMSLVNVAYASALTWANPRQTRLEDQAIVPMFGLHPLELGLSPDDDGWIDRLKKEPRYAAMFAAAFADAGDPFTLVNVTKAIAAFERAIVSWRSPYDRYHFDRDETAISGAARRGEALFNSQPLSCFRCHGGVNFSGNGRFENNGSSDLGIFEQTRDESDVGKFKVPTLRNIAVTAPYMHDGRLTTLEQVIDHYASGGGSHLNTSPMLKGFTLTPEQRKDLMAFLTCLTDAELLKDPRFSDPWPH
jgi:cytochrome c peroxidase